MFSHGIDNQKAEAKYFLAYKVSNITIKQRKQLKQCDKKKLSGCMDRFHTILGMSTIVGWSFTEGADLF